MGIYNVNISSGMQSEPFAANRSIKEQKIRGNDRPYFQEILIEPLEFTVSFAFSDTWNDEQIKDVARWLTTPSFYSPLLFSDDLEKIYYALFIDSPEIVHNSLRQGYINLKVRCSDAYTYSPVYQEIFDLSNNGTNGTQINITNLGSVKMKPIVEIYKVGAGDINIYNLSNGNAEMSMIGLADMETVTIDCEAEDITTDIPLTYRYNNLQGSYLSLVTDNNYLLIKGKSQIRIAYQYKRIQ